MTFEEKYRKSGRTSLADASAEQSDAAPALPAMDTLKAAANTTDDYKAFYPQSQPQFDLWVRPNEANDSPATAIPYGRRVNMTVDDGWFVIIMQFDSGPVLSVRLHGRNLEEIFMRLLGHEVVYVREFDARKWSEVPEGEPCITGIDVRYRPAPVERDAATTPKEHEPEKPSTH